MFFFFLLWEKFKESYEHWTQNSKWQMANGKSHETEIDIFNRFWWWLNLVISVYAYYVFHSGFDLALVAPLFVHFDKRIIIIIILFDIFHHSNAYYIWIVSILYAYIGYWLLVTYLQIIILYECARIQAQANKTWNHQPLIDTYKIYKVNIRVLSLQKLSQSFVFFPSFSSLFCW